jgi:hypothetical protein
MAARRLLIVLVILLSISTLAAIVAPPPDQGADEEEMTDTTRSRTDRRGGAARGKLVRAAMEVGEGQPSTVRLEVGDQLSLRVRSRQVKQIEITGLGLVEDAERGAPARFDVFADHPGRFDVRLLGRERTVGRIVVERPAPDEPARRDRASDTATS